MMRYLIDNIVSRGNAQQNTIGASLIDEASRCARRRLNTPRAEASVRCLLICHFISVLIRREYYLPF